jgi:putative modified peptide
MAFQLPEPIIDALLDRLGNDDAFRVLFAADPRAALAGLGFEAAADSSIRNGIWNCLAVTELASKDSIRATHALLRQELVAQRAAQMPISLQVARPDRKAA